MTYEYACKACGHTWEQEQKISKPPERRCPSCGKEAAQRQINSQGGFRLEGSGWARDGYR